MPRSLHPGSVFLSGLVIDYVEVGTGLSITARPVAASARYPACDQPSSRIHILYRLYQVVQRPPTGRMSERLAVPVFGGFLRKHRE